MRVIGLTGGIATGKSLVAKIIHDLGAPIIDADMVAREVVKPGEKAWLDIVYAFGRDILHDDGDIDRNKLGKIVFSDKNALNKLNNITHPAVIQQINEEIKSLQSDKNIKALLVVVPLLFEAGMEKMMDEVWVVATDETTQLKRLMQRENLTPAEAEQRIKAQMPLEEKIARANQVINNNGDIDNTRQVVIGLWERLMAQLNQE